MTNDMQSMALAPAGLAAPADEAARVRRRRLQRAVKRGLLLLALAGIAVAMVRALTPDPLTVELSTVVRGPLLVTVDETGRTRVRDRFLISAPLAGRLTRITLRPGDAVRAGDTLARLEPLPPPLLDHRTRAELKARVSAGRFAERQAHAVLAQAASTLAQAERDVVRARALAASDALTPAELERAELALRVRRDERTSAEFGARVADEELRRAVAALGAGSDGRPPEAVPLRSPVDGQVLRVLQENEGPVALGAPLVEVGDPAALEVVVDVLTADAVAVRPGAPVQIEGWGGASALPARVRRIEPSAFTRVSALGVEEQRVNVIVDLDAAAPARPALGDGFRVEARLVVSAAASTLVVPSGAVVRSGGGWAVYRLDDEDRARLQAIEIGGRNPREVEVRAGLTAGDRVVLYPGDRLRDGARVRTRAP